MDALAGPLHLLALVLVVSGVQKLVDPRPAGTAMRSATLPVPFGERATGTALGVAETTTGLVAVAVPHALAAAWLGVFYLALAGFVVRLRRRDASAGCGCFGSSSAPPTTAHVVVNLVAAAVALSTAVTGVPDIVDVLDGGPGVAVPYLALLATGAGLVLLAPALFADLARIPDEPRRFRGVR